MKYPKTKIAAVMPRLNARFARSKPGSRTGIDGRVGWWWTVTGDSGGYESASLIGVVGKHRAEVPVAETRSPVRRSIDRVVVLDVDTPSRSSASSRAADRDRFDPALGRRPGLTRPAPPDLPERVPQNPHTEQHPQVHGCTSSASIARRHVCQWRHHRLRTRRVKPGRGVRPATLSWYRRDRDAFP